jgi:hypothetical protein
MSTRFAYGTPSQIDVVVPKRNIKINEISNAIPSYQNNSSEFR